MTCAEYRKILEHLEYATVEEVALALIHLMDCAECKREGRTEQEQTIGPR